MICIRGDQRTGAERAGVRLGDVDRQADVHDHGGYCHLERDLIRERVKSGLAAARAKGKTLGRQAGQRPSDKKARKVLEMAGEGLSYRLIGRNLGMSKNTVMEIIKRGDHYRRQGQVARFVTEEC
jgi:DNA invertase Pin-like site-specific DNA recombinase